MHLKPYPAAQQGALAPGARLHDLRFTLPSGRAVSLYDNRWFGWPAVLHFAATPEAAAAGCARLCALADDFAGLEARIYVVTGGPDHDNGALAQRLGAPFPVLRDAEGALSRALTLAPDATPDATPDAAGSQGPRTLVFDPILRLEAAFAEPDAARQCDRALAMLRARASARPSHIVTEQPPVLVLPRVLEPEHCRRLIQLWETSEKTEGRVGLDAAGGDEVNLRTKVRTDVAVPDGSAESRDLLDAISRQLLPEVLKAFGFRVTRVETPRIGCYDAGQGGHFAAHRDNTTRQTEYRRFAMSLNLNSGEYEGGHLRFPEFGPQLYAPESGGAVVFCCALLHLAAPVTKGRRFGLFAFFYGEEEEALRQRINAEFETGTPPRPSS